MDAANLKEATSSTPVLAPVRVDNVCIHYRRYLRKDQTLKSAALNLFKGTRFEEFEAVKGVSFEVQSGESFGIIGPNGSGKSTLIKSLAGILNPASGTIQVDGRIAPMVELTGGFNSELTGRENIFLNGAIMGLSRRMIQDRLQRVIDFADIGDFIDAPVNSYSSGMRARLGFAVTSDVDADVLLLDEVFSVGDRNFRDKAVKRIEGFFRSEKTVVTVSHDMNMIKRLCGRVMYLKAGKVMKIGPAGEVVDFYDEDQASR